MNAYPGCLLAQVSQQLWEHRQLSSLALMYAERDAAGIGGNKTAAAPKSFT